MAEDRPPLLTFADPLSLDQWLEEHGATSPGAWFSFAKQGAPEGTISKSDAIDCALAHGRTARLEALFAWTSRLTRVISRFPLRLRPDDAGWPPVPKGTPPQQESVESTLSLLVILVRSTRQLPRLIAAGAIATKLQGRE